MKKDRKWIWIVLGLIGCLAVGWLGLRWWNRDVVPVKTAAVARGLIEEVVTASGTVNGPVYELDTKLGGKISVLHVKEGDRVGKGQVLAELDNTSRLVSPNSGMVAKIDYVEGETIPPGIPAIYVVNHANSWVEAQIDEIDIAHIRIGDKVKITSDVYEDKEFVGHVSWITPRAELRRVGGRVKMDEESYVFPCKIKFLGNHDELKVNMSVNVEIITRKKDKALLVAREALLSKDDSTYVYVIKKNRGHESKITVDIRSYSSVEASSGVAEGDIVAISNLNKLKDKARVKIEK